MLRQTLASKTSRVLYGGVCSLSELLTPCRVYCDKRQFDQRMRPFGTNGRKRALKEQQQKDGTYGNFKKEDPIILPKIAAVPPPAPRPPSLIRTDFAVDSSEEIPTIISDQDGSPLNAAEAYVDYKGLYDPKVHLPSAPVDWSGYEPATPLWRELAAQIGVLGRPMTVAEFCHHALLHPQFGYYSQPSRIVAEESDDDLFDNDNRDDDANRNNPIFGARGDFVTAPEICQVFGESIQVWFITQWEAMGRPTAMQWVEFGPGNGTLMVDMVRFARTHPKNNNNSTASGKLQDYANALKVIHLIEPSHPLRAKQQASLREKLGDLVNWNFHGSPATNAFQQQAAHYSMETIVEASTKPTIDVYWHDSFGALSAMIMRRKQRTMGHSPTEIGVGNADDGDVASMPLFIVCQEFFDALPVHAFEMTQEGWRERMVDVAIRDELLEEEIDDDNTERQTPPKSTSVQNQPSGQKRPRLRIVLAPEATPALKTLLHVDEEGRMLGGDQAPITDVALEEGQVVEVCPEGILLVQDIAALLEQQGGASIIVDYGEEGSRDSLRGFWKHKQTHFLSLPGQTDVTADVDFAALKLAVNFARPRRIALQIGSSGADASSANTTIRAYGPIQQGKFLVSMGAKERVIQSIESDSTSDEEAEDLFHALERLVSPDQMGARYKILAIAAERKDSGGSFTVPPAGFS